MSSNIIYYVYFYLRSKDSQNGKAGTPYYIGKDKKKRAWTTHNNVHRPKNRENILIVESNLTELQAFMWERYLNLKKTGDPKRGPRYSLYTWQLS